MAEVGVGDVVGAGVVVVERPSPGAGAGAGAAAGAAAVAAAVAAAAAAAAAVVGPATDLEHGVVQTGTGIEVAAYKAEEPYAEFELACIGDTLVAGIVHSIVADTDHIQDIADSVVGIVAAAGTIAPGLEPVLLADRQQQHLGLGPDQ